MQRQRPKQRVAQLSVLFVAPKMPQEQGNVTHPEQRVLFFPSPCQKPKNAYRTHVMQGQTGKTAF